MHYADVMEISRMGVGKLWPKFDTAPKCPRVGFFVLCFVLFLPVWNIHTFLEKAGTTAIIKLHLSNNLIGLSLCDM